MTTEHGTAQEKFRLHLSGKNLRVVEIGISMIYFPSQVHMQSSQGELVIVNLAFNR